MPEPDRDGPGYGVCNPPNHAPPKHPDAIPHCRDAGRLWRGSSHISHIDVRSSLRVQIVRRRQLRRKLRNLRRQCVLQRRRLRRPGLVRALLCRQTLRGRRLRRKLRKLSFGRHLRPGKLHAIEPRLSAWRNVHLPGADRLELRLRLRRPVRAERRHQHVWDLRGLPDLGLHGRELALRRSVRQR